MPSLTKKNNLNHYGQVEETTSRTQNSLFMSQGRFDEADGESDAVIQDKN